MQGNEQSGGLGEVAAGPFLAVSASVSLHPEVAPIPPRGDLTCSSLASAVVVVGAIRTVDLAAATSANVLLVLVALVALGRSQGG